MFKFKSLQTMHTYSATLLQWTRRFLKLFAFPRKLKNAKDKPLMAELASVFPNQQRCEDLVRCQGPDAQRLLDSFQPLLDRLDLELPFRKDLNTATQRLSSNSGLHPSCYKLRNVAQIGEYPISSGGFADIYQGKFQGQLVCMKTTRLYQTSQVDHLVKSFWKEAMIWGQLSHPNVLTIYGLYLFRNRVSIVAPWMENGDISAYLKDNPGAPRPQLVMDTGSGLSYLHDNDIIHGDLKGANVLVDGTGRARLADFGIWSVMDADIVSWTTQTTTSLEGGSVRWKAPELFDVENDVSVKNSKESDVYALGCVFFEIFTGEVPYSNIPHGTTVTLQVRSGTRPTCPEPSSPSWNDFGLTEEIWTCMEQCWDANLLGRPPAAEIVRRLARNLARDTRPSPNVGRLSPREFRYRMRVPFKMITVKELRVFLEKSANRRLGTELSSDHLSLDER